MEQSLMKNRLHQTPDFCGHWVRQLYRKNQVRKNQGYCYVVIRALDSQHCANFKKPQILRVHIFYDWVHEIYFLKLDTILGKYIICHMTLWHFYLILFALYNIAFKFSKYTGKNPFLHKKIRISRKCWGLFWFFPKKYRKNWGFDPQISRIVHDSGHRKSQKRKLRGRKNRGFGVWVIEYK